MKLGLQKWLLLGAVACGGATAAGAGAQYRVGLEECNRNAKTLCESIACENAYRTEAKRLLRDVPQHCKAKDGGVE